MWLEREAIAQERFRKKREDEERKLKEKLEQEVMHVRVRGKLEAVDQWERRCNLGNDKIAKD